MSNIADIKVKEPKSEKVDVHAPSDKPNQNVDVLLLAFYQLLDASNVSLESANTEAKSLRANQSAMDSEQKALSGIKFNVITQTGKIVHYWHILNSKNVIQTSRKTVPRTPGGATVQIGQTFTYWFYDGGWYTVDHCHIATAQKDIPISSSIYKVADLKNQQVEADRSYLSGQLMGLQMNSKVSMANMNTISDSAAQEVKLGLNFLDLLSTLALKIGQMHARAQR